MSASFHSEFETRADEPAVHVRTTLRGIDLAAPAGVVNRTHRVVRHRATAMQERRSYLRSLLLPLILCSVLLTLAGLAVWTGMYQYQAVEAAEAVQADVTTLDANNHLLVAVLWFVPVSLALLVAVWGRHKKNGDRETTR